ncbi:hypothetical protein J8F10_03640 [Gemmata sp. G18]|uniref:Uncharacterized protein n=1 Tax=Gemmata palustris TaxID=2822762 RepID=A0ABS5BL16_9BACT|nr:hypothetical protein [Gemmata palustris]MBP3954383.1 hypothetical protein [Gemmata palustris]
MQAKVVEEVRRRIGPKQAEMFSTTDAIAEVVAKTTEQIVLGTIDIPRIIVVPNGEVRSGYKQFKLNVTSIRYPVPSDELWAQNLRSGQREVINLGRGGIEEQRLEDYVVGGLVDFDDVSYDDHADMLYDLATLTVNHLRGYLVDEMDVRKVLRVYQKQIAELIHSQMQQNYWEEATGYEIVVSKGFTELKDSAFTASATDTVLDYRQPPADKGKIGQLVYAGFTKCLYRLQKFQSDTERKMAVILERDSCGGSGRRKGSFKSSTGFHTISRNTSLTSSPKPMIAFT